MRAAAILTLAFLSGFFLIGIPYWSLDYSEVALPDSLSPFGLAAVATMAFLLVTMRISSLRKSTATMLAAPATAVMARVVYETSLDPTSHNLWPFEIVYTLLATALFVVPAVLLALAVRRWAS